MTDTWALEAYNNLQDCAAQPGLAIHHYQVRKGDDGFPRLTIVGCQPQVVEAYAEAFEIDGVDSTIQ